MKKTILITSGIIFVVVALVVAIAFAFGGNKEDLPENDPISLEGTWVVAANCANGTTTFVQNQTMTFTKDQAAMYKDNGEAPYASSTYSINESKQLLLPDISREYKIDLKSNNIVCLYDTTTSYMILVKNGNAVTTDALKGKWNVNIKGDQINNGDALEFTDAALNYYKANSATPAATSSFEFSNEGVLIAKELGLDLRCYLVNESTLILIEQSGVIWELSKS